MTKIRMPSAELEEHLLVRLAEKPLPRRSHIALNIRVSEERICRTLRKLLAKKKISPEVFERMIK